MNKKSPPNEESYAPGFRRVIPKEVFLAMQSAKRTKELIGQDLFFLNSLSQFSLEYNTQLMETQRQLLAATFLLPMVWLSTVLIVTSPFLLYTKTPRPNLYIVRDS